VNDLIDFVIVHQGIIDPHDPMSPQKIIVSVLRAHVMPIPTALKDVMEHVGAGGNDDIDELHLDHVPEDPPHPSRYHRSGETHEDYASRVIEHLSKGFKAFVDIPALKRGVLKGLDQVKKAMGRLEVQVMNRFSEVFGFSFFSHPFEGPIFLRRVTNNGKQVKKNMHPVKHPFFGNFLDN
jgi:hypothetical protein